MGVRLFCRPYSSPFHSRRLSAVPLHSRWFAVGGARMLAGAGRCPDKFFPGTALGAYMLSSRPLAPLCLGVEIVYSAFAREASAYLC